jgi:hypothetical protein
MREVGFGLGSDENPTGLLPNLFLLPQRRSPKQGPREERLFAVLTCVTRKRPRGSGWAFRGAAPMFGLVSQVELVEW